MRAMKGDVLMRAVDCRPWGSVHHDAPIAAEVMVQTSRRTVADRHIAASALQHCHGDEAMCCSYPCAGVCQRILGPPPPSEILQHACKPGAYTFPCIA
jgi:hypothetical protein